MTASRLTRQLFLETMETRVVPTATVSAVSDIQPLTLNPDSTVNGKTLFGASPGSPFSVGNELFVTDGTTAGTKLLKDLSPGISSSSPSKFFKMGNTIFFVADTQENGRELWKSNGTASGTTLVKDIYPGTGDSGIDNFTKVTIPGHGDWVYFTASDPINGRELWRTNGTAVGTQRVSDFAFGTGGIKPSWLTVHDGRLYIGGSIGSASEFRIFRLSPTGIGADEVFYDSTATGQPRVASIPGKLVFSVSKNGLSLMVLDTTQSTPLLGMVVQYASSQMIAFHGEVYFDKSTSSGSQLWKTDGTPSGTLLLKDINTQPYIFFNTDPQNFAIVGNHLYFSATTQKNGQELWRTDGTDEGTVLTFEANSGSANGSPSALINFEDRLIFEATTSGGHSMFLYEPLTNNVTEFAGYHIQYPSAISAVPWSIDRSTLYFSNNKLFKLKIPSVLPQAPMITKIGDDTGILGDGRTSDKTVHLSGYASPGKSVRISAGSRIFGTTVVDSSGMWNFTTPALTDGNYAFVARAINSAGQVSSASPTVNVAIDTKPVTGVTLSGLVPENAPIGTLAGNLSATGVALGEPIMFELVSGNGDTDNDQFTLDGSSLFTDNVFDFESRSTYSIRVRATDAAGNATEKIVNVPIGNVNEMPIGISLSATVVAKEEPAGLIVGDLSTLDPDAQDTHTLTLVTGDGSDDNSLFEITGRTLKTAAVLNTANQLTRTIRVRSTDSGGLYTEANFTLAVVSPTPPSLDNSPTLFLPKIPSNITNPNGFPVIQLLKSATDAETPNTVGVAITGTKGISGTWQYAPTSSGPWTTITLVSESSAFLLDGSAYARFVPKKGLSGFAGLSFRAWDGQSASKFTRANVADLPVSIGMTTETAWISVGRTSPELDDQNRVILTTMTEDSKNPTTTIVSRVLSFLPLEFAPGTKSGIAVIGTEGIGEWQVRVGTEWMPITALNPTNALLLKSTDQIRFVPDDDWSGEATISYRVWDSIHGPVGPRADVTTQSGFGIDTQIAAMTILPINDAPNLDISIPRVFDTTEQSVATLLTGSFDIDSPSLGIAITRVIAVGGRWEYRLSPNGPWTKLIGVSLQRSLLLDSVADLHFLPDTGAITARGQFDYKAWDRSSGGTSGAFKAATGTAFSVATETATFSIGNSAPIFKSGDEPVFPTMSLSKKPTIQSVSLLLGRMTDTLGFLKGVAVSSITGTGLWEYSLDAGKTWQAVDDVTTKKLLLRSTDRLRFTPSSNTPGTATLSFAAWDQTTGASGDRITGTNDSMSNEILTAKLVLV